MPTDHSFDFRSIAVGASDDPLAEPNPDVVTPIHLSTTFELSEPGFPETGHCYGRLGNPTRERLERRVAALSGATDVVATGSGTASISTVCFTLLRPGDHVVASDSLYGGTTAVFEEFVSEFGIAVDYVDATDADAVAEAITPETELVWVESPTNPLMRLCDLPALGDLTAERGVALVVDNTFATPYAQRPLETGADVTIASTTKFLNGHTDSVGGVVATADPDLAERFRFVCQDMFGAALPPFDCYLVLRGLKTLGHRMDAHEATATAVAEFLADHDAVRTVNYPGLESHPQRDLARRDLSNFGGMVSFELDGDAAEARAFVESLSVFSLAMSLGGVESLVEHPASMSAAALSEEERAAAGVSDSLVRLSVGLESPNDLLPALEDALAPLA